MKNYYIAAVFAVLPLISIFFSMGYINKQTEIEKQVVKHCEKIAEYEFYNQFTSIEDCIMTIKI